jgi:hypothetical protein
MEWPMRVIAPGEACAGACRAQAARGQGVVPRMESVILSDLCHAVAVVAEIVL